MSREPTMHQGKWKGKERKKEGRNMRANSNAALKLSFVIEGPSRTI
jgi:hypothetical protein